MNTAPPGMRFSRPLKREAKAPGLGFFGPVFSEKNLHLDMVDMVDMSWLRASPSRKSRNSLKLYRRTLDSHFPGGIQNWSQIANRNGPTATENRLFSCLSNNQTIFPPTYLHFQIAAIWATKFKKLTLAVRSGSWKGTEATAL